MHSLDAAYLAWKWAAFIIYYFVSTKENLYRKILGLSQSMGLYTLVMAIAASFFGRLVSGGVAQWLGPIVTWALCAFASGVLSLCWISVDTEAKFIAFSVLWGTQVD